jgi:hypothetical protein
MAHFFFRPLFLQNGLCLPLIQSGDLLMFEHPISYRWFCFSIFLILLYCSALRIECSEMLCSRWFRKKGRANHFVDFFHVEEKMKLKYITKTEHFFLLDLISYKMQCAYLGVNLLICLCLNTPFNIGGFAFRYFLYVFHVE